MSLRIETVDTRTAPEDLLREMHEHYLLVDEELLPGDPPMPYERRAAGWQQIRSDQAVPRWLLRVDGRIVASAFSWMHLEQNLGIAYGRVFVSPGQRGDGHARRLAAVMFDRLEECGRSRFETYVREDAAEARLLERAGMTPGYRDRRSRLVLAEVDMDLMRSWIERTPDRADDYELLALQAPFPDEVVDRYCELQFQMNSAPTEALEREDEVLEPRIWREQEERLAASHHDLLTCVAVHRPTGAFVGSTSVQTDRLYPQQASQVETVVHPAHRNRGLGRWLKAAMIERLVTDWPQVERIDTVNAGSNEPMLNINLAMGFRPIQVLDVYQGELAAVRRRLAV